MSAAAAHALSATLVRRMMGSGHASLHTKEPRMRKKFLSILAVVVLAFVIARILGASGVMLGTSGLVTLLAVSTLVVLTVTKLWNRAHT
jgi:hypothetical protein